jgi:hypothetical protein
MRTNEYPITNTVAWMISGGGRFDESWAEGMRHRAAIAEARGDEPSRFASVTQRVRAVFAPTSDSD